jgi:hypothetical protein
MKTSIFILLMILSLIKDDDLCNEKIIGKWHFPKEDNAYMEFYENNIMRIVLIKVHPKEWEEPNEELIINGKYYCTAVNEIMINITTDEVYEPYKILSLNLDTLVLKYKNNINTFTKN